ncbi:unnamed protein product [Symbiodinium sp. CCMP2592]|nr:unnamed protein product [Symbiodinium sp. CCMP2592]
MTEADFRNMTHARAAVVGAQACKNLARAVATLAQVRKVKRQVVAQATKTSKQLKLAQDSQSQQSPLELVVSKSGKRLTSESILALGIRRNLTHIAAADVGAMLLRDMSESTVLRAEVRTGASVNACMKEFANNALAELRAPAADGDGGHDHADRDDAHVSDVDLADISYGGKWNLVFISVRADATNSNIWRREKLHVCEAQMGLVCKPVKSYPLHAEDFLHTKRCLRQPQHRSDLQVVSGSTAEHCAGIMQKQLNSIGVPSVADLLADMDTENSCLKGRSVIAYLDTTDRGTDQTARKKRTACSVGSVDNLVYIASDCYLHVFHSAVRSGLVLTDSLISECFSKEVLGGFDKYYASLAKLVNVWREKASQVMKAWDDHHGSKDADTRALGSRYPLSVSSGRWGSVENAEEFLIERGRPLLEPCILQALSSAMKADVGALAADAPADASDRDGPSRCRFCFLWVCSMEREVVLETMQSVNSDVMMTLVYQGGQGGEDAADHAIVLDDVKEHETDAYRLKLSKWSQSAMNTITSPIFWCLLYLCRALRSPLRHFMLFVQKGAKLGDCMFRLVTMKLDEFTAEFSALFQKLPEIVDKALQLSGCFHETKGLSHADIVRMRYLALRLLLLHWAAFRRRIIRPLRQYPMKLFWLIKSHPKRFCKRRQQVAEELIGLDAHQLDSATRKIRELCCRELQHLRITGVFPDVSSPSGSFLYAFLKGLARMLPADTQAIEGINSLIKLMGRRAPNISLELMSSRLAIRRALSEDHSMARKKKWSAIKNTAEGLMKSIVGFKTASLAILSNDGRWSMPLPANCGSGVLPAVLAITDREAVLSVRGPEDQTGSSAASSAEAGRGQPGNSLLVADLAKAKSSSGISWAKSYNLAWRRATTSSTKKNKQQDAGHRVGSGLLIAVVETDGEGNDGLVQQQQPPLFFAVAEKFSVSVMFSKIHCVQINGHPCLQWVYEENNCVESTLFFLSFYGACSGRGLRLRVGYVVLSPDMSHLLLPGWRTDAEGEGEIRVASVLQLVNHVFVMTAESHPSAAKSGKPQSGRKRKDAPEADANEADVDPPNVADYIDDNDNFLDDVEVATDAEDSDDDNTAQHEMQEINEASAAAATDPARLPSSKNVFAVAEDIHRNAELIPDAAVEEEALLLLVRRARSQKAKNMGVGCRSTGSTGHVLPGEDSTQPQPHMGSQLPEESGEVMGEASLASQREPVDTEGVLGDARSGADASASDNESDIEAELPHDIAALLRSKAMVDLQRDGHVLKRWVMACHLMLEAMHEYAKTKDVLLGTDRSISLVHGLIGRQGREVRLDDNGKVLFSVADCTMYRTGISNGIGYPELCLDDRHAHVLLPSVRAAMRKVKRTDPDRDAVSPHFLRLRDFCEYMLTSVSQSTNPTTDDEIPDEDR